MITRAQPRISRTQPKRFRLTIRPEWKEQHPSGYGMQISFWSNKVQEVMAAISEMGQMVASDPGTQVRLIEWLNTRYTGPRDLISSGGYYTDAPDSWFTWDAEVTQFAARRAAESFLARNVEPDGPIQPGPVGDNMNRANVYVVRPGDSADSIAARYTGDASRWPELTSVNPQAAAASGTLGAPPMFRDLKVGQTIFVPRSWGTFDGAVPAGFHENMASLGTLGYTADPDAPQEVEPGEIPEWQKEREGDCNPGTPITDIKPYAFQTGSDYPAQVATNWTGDFRRWHELRRANYDEPAGFAYVYDADGNRACNWRVWGGGKAIKIPASWPDAPGMYTDDLIDVDDAFPGTYVSDKDKKAGMPWYWIPVGIAIAVGLTLAWETRPKVDTRAQKADY